MNGYDYTPGEWNRKVNENADHRQEVVAKVKGLCVASCGHGNEALANANLIAAAPDLLAALEYMLAWTGAIPPSQSGIAPPTEDKATAIARAAIAKAKGGGL